MSPAGDAPTVPAVDVPMDTAEVDRPRLDRTPPEPGFEFQIDDFERSISIIGRLREHLPDDLIEITMHDQTGGTAHRHTAIGHAADFGTLFCALAGLINFAVALDAGARATPDRRGGGR